MKEEKVSTVNNAGHIVAIENALIRQQEHIILRDVNLTIKPGEFTYMIGRVGSGKSSLLKTLYGEIPLREGAGFVVGFDLLKIKPKHIPWLRRRMGIIFQDFQLLIDRNVYDNLHFVLKATGWKNQVEMDHASAKFYLKSTWYTKATKCPTSFQAASNSA
ncbi:ATP-binding cassette domain-containing protein [Geofilum rubicundum]|uniref:Cell division transporter, ATP-binding protein FtsE n=1 Tax=Geofilum rubicundum JCM 15548 TaxID=1236989 RepID=A0A0E9LRL5_9BACT|nr:ATP-binding cassette domain-containing protein [Geofilum rubicundum]GAO27874.1 cell division transporter, ATP-binding protein FtsE [Geofilum rubicundum JCM 15548]